MTNDKFRSPPKRYDWSTYRTSGHRLVVTTVKVGERLIKAADRFLRPYRLTLTQFDVLVELIAAPEGLPQSGLGSRLVVSRANVTGLVRRLKRLGLCRTGSDAADGRVKKVYITPAGARLLGRIRRPYFSRIEDITRALRASDLGRAADVLDRLGAGL